MTPNPQDMRNDFEQGPLSHGGPVRFRYFTISGATTGYDDDKTYAKSGTDVWTSGLTRQISTRRGSNDAVLLEQGRLLMDDLKLYVKHDVNTSGLFTVGLGSPVQRVYAPNENGVISQTLNGEDVIFKKTYIRYLTNGSLF